MGGFQFNKNSAEEFVIAGGITNVVGDGEALVGGSSTVTAEDVNGEDVTATVLDTDTKSVDGNYLKCLCRAGTEALSPYQITFKMVTDAANTYIVVVAMDIMN